jgi:predicted dehydrogenase
MRNVAVIGLGIGRSHLSEGYANLTDRFRVVALCDLNEARLSEVGEQFGVERRTTSFDEVLAMPDVDIIDICTPPSIHADQVIAALEAGREVVCEKPLVGSLADLDRVVAAERVARGHVMPIFQYRWGEGFQRAWHIVRTGLAGRPYTAVAETSWQRRADYYAIAWRGKYATELGGVLLTQAIHLHDMMCCLMGDVKSVYARTATRVNPIEVEDCATASLEMQSGALASISATLGSTEQISRLRAHFEHVTFESSLAPFSPGDEPWRILPASPEAAARIEAALQGFAPVPRRFHGQMAAYADALDYGGVLPVTLDDARRALELVTALYASAETGEAVPLPLPISHPRYVDWRPEGSVAPRAKRQFG